MDATRVVHFNLAHAVAACGQSVRVVAAEVAPRLGLERIALGAIGRFAVARGRRRSAAGAHFFHFVDAFVQKLAQTRRSELLTRRGGELSHLLFQRVLQLDDVRTQELQLQLMGKSEKQNKRQDESQREEGE